MRQALILTLLFFSSIGFYSGCSNTTEPDTLYIEDQSVYYDTLLLDSTMEKVVNLSNTEISEISFPGNPGEIEWLVLSGLHVTDLSPLTSIDSLTRLWLNECGELENIDTLKSLKYLIWLDISGTDKLTEIGVLSSMPALEYLRMGSSADIDHSVIDSLPNLEHLVFEENNIDTLSYTNLPSLNKIKLDGCLFLSFLMFKGMPGLDTLEINGFGSLTAVKLKDEMNGLKFLSLKNDSSLVTLDLSGAVNLEHIDISGSPNLISDSTYSYLKDTIGITKIDTSGF